MLPKKEPTLISGFTYIELTIALTIVVVLAAIAVPNFLEGQSRSQVSRSKSEQMILKMAIEEYRLDYKAYPPNKVTGKPNPFDLVVLTTPVNYITRLPEDPFTLRRGYADGKAIIKPPVPYNYLNALQINPEKGLMAKKDIELIGPGFIAGLIWGRGPGNNWPQSDSTETSVAPDGTLTLSTYDATNGTVSTGDIYTRIP